MATRIQLRRGTSAQWAAGNPILAEGEVGVETDTHRIKFGDGINTWTGLPYSTMVQPDVFVSDTEPTEAVDDDVWIDTASDPVETIDIDAAVATIVSQPSFVQDVASQPEVVQAAADAVSNLSGTGIQTTVADAVGEWWIHPMATYQSSPYPRTVFGAIASDGKVLACEYNHGTGKTKRYEIGTALGPQGLPDDHNPPSLWVLDGHRPLAVWTQHNATDMLYLKVGARSGDIASLQGATLVEIDTIYKASYSEVHRIAHLSDDTQDTFWIFFRRFQGNEWYWIIQSISVAQATGAITDLGRVALIYAESRQSYVATADAFSDGNQVIRVGLSTRPIEPTSHIYYLEIDCVTGAITSPVDAALTANIDGTNLPILDSTMTPLVPDEAGMKRWIYAVRSGPDEAAVGYAQFPEADTAAGNYYLTEFTGYPGRGLDPGTGRVTTPDSPAFSYANGFVYTTIVTLPASAPASISQLARQFNSGGGQPGWALQIKSDKVITMRLATSINGSVSRDTTAALPVNWGDTVGIRFEVDMAASRLRIYYSTDPLAGSPTYTLLGSSIAITAGQTVTAPGAPLQVPNGSDTAMDPPQFVYLAELRDWSSTLLAGVDFRTEWATGEATFTDDAGRVWTAEGDAATVDAIETSDLGPTGGRIGYIPEAAYLPGVAFEVPSYDRAVIVARSDSTTAEVVKVTPSGEEVLETQAVTAGRFARPVVPVNGGPFRAVVSDITAYSDTTYNDYNGNMRGLS